MLHALSPSSKPRRDKELRMRHYPTRWCRASDRRSLFLPIGLIASGLLLSGTACAGQATGDRHERVEGSKSQRARESAPHALTARAQKSFLQLPLSFEPAPERAGHVASSFFARGPGYTLSLGPAGAVLSIADGERPRGSATVNSPLPFTRSSRLLGDLQTGRPSTAAPRNDEGAREAERSSPELVRLELIGANATAPAEGLDPLPGKSNYFTGNDPKAWRTNVPTFARVRYANVYRGVDLVYYGNKRELEYDLIVKPGIDVNAIRFNVDTGATTKQRPFRITSAGDLVIATGQGEIRLRKPVVYQEAPESGRRLVEARYVLASAREVGFQVGGYDHRRPLVIDPTLEYSSFLGGSGLDNGVSTAVGVDSAGNLYIASGTASADFPGTSGGFQGASPGCNLGAGQLCGDAFVTKINATGTAILYSTYLGGSGSDGAYGLAVDAAGFAYVTGFTDSTNFPTTPGAAQAQFGGGTPGCALTGGFASCGDAFVTKVDPSGSVVYSTYLGGSGDDSAQAVAIDTSGNAYVTGDTSSTNYPKTPGAFASPAGSCGTSLCPTLFVSKLNATGSALTYSAVLGAPSVSGGFGIAVNTSGQAYVTGGGGPGFPTPNGFQSPDDSGGAVFVKLDAAGGLQYSTFLSGTSFDFGLGVAVDAIGNAYVVGGAASPDFPVTTGAFQTTFNTAGAFHGFVAKIDPSKSGLSSLVYSSLLGGSGTDAVTAVAVDSAGNAYLAGSTSSPDFPTASPLQGLLATSPACAGSCQDGFVTVLNAAGSQLQFSTYLGGTGHEVLDFLVRHSSGDIYVGGTTTSTRYPTTAGSFQTTYGGGEADMFVAKISAAPNTTIGSNVAVPLTSTASVTFGQVTVAGTTAVTESTVGPAAPAGFALGTPSVFFDISTTATSSGQSSVCVSYDGVTFSGAVPALFHFQNNNWVDVTTSVDGVNQVVCGSVTSFSPFAVFGAIYHATVQAPIAADGRSTFKAQRGSVPVKFTLSLGGAPTCRLLPATISIVRDAGATATAINADVFSLPSDSGALFRIDETNCQYVYNVNARSLGAGTYRVQISISGFLVGSAKFTLQ